MDYITYVNVNAPPVIISLLLNFFFSYCLVFPPPSGKIKQPLKLLLHTLVFCSISYLLCLICEATTWYIETKMIANLIFYLLSLCILSTSMTTSAWLSFFYYATIVPAKRGVSAWMKKNVKMIIYSAWILERLWSLCDLSFVSFRVYPLFLTNASGTADHKQEKVDNAMDVYVIVLTILKSYFLLSICVMLMSNASISLYLAKHIRNMLSSGKSFTGSKIYGQLRVAVSGLLQGTLYLLCAVWISYKFFYEQLQYKLVDSSLHVTLINAYIFGTTLNIWQGQTVFRQRTIDIVKALRSRSSRGGGATASSADDVIKNGH